MNKRQLTDYIVQNQERFYRLAYSYVKNPDDALDIVQEAIAKALAYRSEVKYIKTWFYRIVVNTAITYLNRSARVVEISSAWQEQQAAPDVYADTDLRAALDALPVKYREVVVLRFFEDLTLSEISLVLGVNENTVKTRLYTALDKLRLSEMLSDHAGQRQPKHA